MPTIPAYVFLPAFYAGTVGLGLTATGLVLLLSRTLDVVTDPIVGILTDSVPTRWGRRKPWIVCGGILAAFSLVLLFQPPPGSGIAYLLTWSALLYLGWTFVTIPYTAWGAELTVDYHQRVRVTGARETMGIAGILAASLVAAVAPHLGLDDGGALSMIALIAVGLGTLGVTLLVLRVPEPTGHGTASVHLTRQSLRVIGGNKPFVRLIAAWFLNGLANGIPAALFLLYLEHVLEADDAIRGSFIFGYFVCGIAAIPLWARLAARHGKHRTWCHAMIAACASFIVVPLLGPGDFLIFGIVTIVTGCALGADLALPPAMQADVVDLDTLRSGTNRAGIYFALWSMATKLALAAAVGIAFPLLDIAGFHTEGGNSASTLLTLAVIYSGLPVVFKLFAIALVWRHPIDARRQGIIRRRLEARARRLDLRTART